MGREAKCFCDWSGQTGECKVLLESSELIVRGAIRRRVPLSGLTDVAVKAHQLTFRVGQESISLSLGTVVAERLGKRYRKASPEPRKKVRDFGRLKCSAYR